METPYLNQLEISELYEKIYTEESLHQVRNIAIFEVAKYCALRVSEITNMQIDDYDPFKKTIFCRRLKGSRCNMLRIVDPCVYQALDKYLVIRLKIKTESNFMFLSQKGTQISRQRLDKLMKHYCSQTHIPAEKQHFHVLKHTRAIELAEHGFDVDDIQYWLGHKNVQNTFIYLQYTTMLRQRLFNQLQKLEGGEIKKWRAIKTMQSSWGPSMKVPS